MSSHLSCLDSATLPVSEQEVLGSPQVTPGLAGMIAVRADEVIDPGVGGSGAGALVVASSSAGPVASPIVSGETLMFCHPVVSAPAVVRRGGAVQAGGWLPDYVRLGLLEERLGEGVIEEVIAAAAALGQVGQPVRQRLMSLELAARFTLAMTLMPEADYRETMTALVGHLARVPWARPWQVPSSKVFTTWRRLLGESAMEVLFWRTAGSIIDPGAATGTDVAAGVWCGLELCAIDGFQIALSDTAANRAEFGSSGTADDSAPFPRMRVILVSARAGRATLGAAVDGCDVGERTLITRLVKQRPELFAGRVFLVDRNFPGHELITAIVDAGGHLVMRIKAGIALPLVAGGWLSDGSRMSYLNALSRKKADRLPVRVVEHSVVVPGTGNLSEVYCLATTLLDHQAVPAEQVRAAYPHRWSASETTIGENKTTVTGAGPSTGPIPRSSEPALARQELWAWLTATQLVRRAAAAARPAPVPGEFSSAPPRDTAAGVSPPDHKQVGTDQISFTTIRREVLRSMVQTQVSATISPRAQATLAEATRRAASANPIITGRQRYSARRQKNRPSFPHTQVTTPTVTGPVQIIRHQPGQPSPSR
jgi:hypothetical protein